MNVNTDIRVYVDADSCPVKDEVYKVVLRHQVPALIVANSFLRVPQNHLVKLVLVSSDFDAADNYIAENAGAATVVVTADILLADRCIKAGAMIVCPNGTTLDSSSIGMAVATRDLMADLRSGGEQHGGAAPFSKTDRSRFLSTLHDTLVLLKRRSGAAG